MDLSKKVAKEIEEALDELRDATVRKQTIRAKQVRTMLEKFLTPLGYTIEKHPEKVYVLKKKG